MRKFLLYFVVFYIASFFNVYILSKDGYNMLSYCGQTALFITAAVYSLVALLKILPTGILFIMYIMSHVIFSSISIALGRSGMFDIIDIPLYVASSLLGLGLVLHIFTLFINFLVLTAFFTPFFFSLTFCEAFDFLSLTGGLVLFGISIALRKTSSLPFSVLLILTPYIPFPHLFKIPLVVFITTAIAIYKKRNCSRPFTFVKC